MPVWKSVYVDVQDVLTRIGDPTGQTLASLTAKLGNLGQDLDTVLGYEGAASLHDKLTAARAARLDAAVSSRAAPGDAMALTAAERTTVQALILSDATPFAGANINASIGSRAAPGDAMALTPAERTAVQALILSDATPFLGGNIDAAISSRSSHAAADIWAVATRALTDKAGFTLASHAWPFTNPGSPVAAGNIQIDGLTQAPAGQKTWALASDYTAARATKLDNLDALISSRLAAASYVTERGTDGAALASAWTAARAAILDKVETFHYDNWTAAASENLKHSNDTQRETTSASLVKLKEMKLNAPFDELRLKYYHIATVSGLSYTQVKVNGVNEGAEESVGTAGETVTLDISALAKNDTIELWGRKGSATSHQIKNMRLHYDLTEKPIKTAPTNQDP